jgi:hypothetical protein
VGCRFVAGSLPVRCRFVAGSLPERAVAPPLWLRFGSPAEAALPAIIFQISDVPHIAVIPDKAGIQTELCQATQRLVFEILGLDSCLRGNDKRTAV